MNKYELMNNGCSVLTASFSIAYIKETLSIIILVISILNILLNAFIKIYKHIKEKNYEKALIELEKTKEKLEEIERNDTHE